MDRPSSIKLNARREARVARAWSCATTLLARGLLSVPTAFLCGCYGISTVAPEGTEVRHYFGYVRVVVPAGHATQGQVSSSDVSGAGLRIENGLLLGLFRDKAIAVPLDCRFVMVVRDRAQLDLALATLSTKFSREDLCLAIDPE